MPGAGRGGQPRPNSHLDLGLPDMDGIQVIAGLRGWTPHRSWCCRPGGEAAKVAALDAGADDYVVKPFGMDELLARIRAALRRPRPPTRRRSSPPHFTIDLAAKRVTAAGREIRLTATEWHLLEILVRNDGRTVEHKRLLEEVWGSSYDRRATT